MLEVFKDIEQGSEAWLELRRGLVTCSELSTVLAKGRSGGESITRRKYLLTLAGERMAGCVEAGYSNSYMERGHQDEEEGRALYSMVTDNDIEKVAFIKNGEVGYSPDGLIGTNGLIEVKTKLYHLHLDALLRNEVPNEHTAQCQGGLWVSGREWIDFASYAKGLPLFVKRVHRDEAYIARIKIEVDDFLSEMHELIAKITQHKVAA